jgi:hypothetical protein
MGTVLHLRTINQTTEPRSQTILYGKVKVERQLVRLPWAADSCPWVEVYEPCYHSRTVMLSETVRCSWG